MFDVNSIVKGLRDPQGPAAQFMLARKLSDSVDACVRQSKRLIYVSKSLSPETVKELGRPGALGGRIGKRVIVDNGVMMKRRDMYPLFDEAVFYTAWKKIS